MISRVLVTANDLEKIFEVIKIFMRISIYRTNLKRPNDMPVQSLTAVAIDQQYICCITIELTMSIIISCSSI